MQAFHSDSSVPAQVFISDGEKDIGWDLKISSATKNPTSYKDFFGYEKPYIL